MIERYDSMQLYFREMVGSSLNFAEEMLEQGRKAKAQEYFTTAMYFAAKVDAETLGIDLGSKLDQIRRKIYS